MPIAPSPHLTEKTTQSREKRITGLLAGFTALWLLLGTLASMSGVELYELSHSSESWIYIEDQFRGQRYTCSGYRSTTCGLWLYPTIHEEPLFYERHRPNFMLLKQTPLNGKSMQMWYACPWMGRCEPGELIVEGLGTMVTFEDTEDDLRIATFMRFLVAAVTLIPGFIFSYVVYRRLFYPLSKDDHLDIVDTEKQRE